MRSGHRRGLGLAAAASIFFVGFSLFAGARAADGVPVTIVYTPSIAMNACVESIRSADAKIGADPVELTFSPDGKVSGSGRAVSLRLYRPEGTDPFELMNLGRAKWRIVRRPFAFKDAAHFRRFQISALAEELGQGEYFAYGGANHLFTFRLPMTEPGHFDGKSILGSRTGDIYDAFGATHESWVDRDWNHGARLALKGETETLAIETKGIIDRIAKIRSDRSGIAGIEMPLFSVKEFGIDKVARFLNLSFSSVDPIVIDPSDLIDHVPESQHEAAKAWARAIGLACSAGVFQEEAKTIAALKAGGVKVAPMNRAAFAPKVWLADLGYAYGNYLVSQLDALVAMGWKLDSRPSDMLSTLEPKARAALVKEDEEAKAESAEKQKQRDASAAHDAVHARVRAVMTDVIAEYTDALRKMPAPRPSGHLVGFLGLPPAQKITAAPVASGIADDLEAILEPVRTCPTAQAPCSDQISAWLDIARTRAATKSKWSLWSSQGQGVDQAIERAISLARSAADGTFHGDAAAAMELKKIGEAQSEIGNHALRKTVDAAAALMRTSWPPHPSEEDEKDADRSISDRREVDEWTVLRLHGLGDDAAARARFKEVQAFRVRTKAAVASKEWQYDDPWKMRLALGDYDEAWADHIDEIERLDQQSRFDCWYGSQSCAGRRDIRRASVLAQTALGFALKDLKIESPEYDQDWLRYVNSAFEKSDTPDLAREHANLVKELQAISVSDVDPRAREWAAQKLEFDALDRAKKNQIICAFRKCLGGDPFAETETHPVIAHGGHDPWVSSPDATHPFQVAIAAKDWTTVFAALDRMAQAGKEDGAAEKVHAELFPGVAWDAYKQSTENLALAAATAAAKAGDLAAVRRAVVYDGDTKAGTFEGARPKSLDALLQMLVTTAAVE